MSAAARADAPDGLALERHPMIAWHDAENGSYGADLPFWEELADEHRGTPIVDLGAGTGRVALHLAARGHRITAVDDDRRMLDVLAGRAAAHGLEVETVHCDVRALTLPAESALIIAPMQLLHILGGPEGRRRALAAVAACLRPGGRFYAAVLEEPLPLGTARPEPIPDVREISGTVYSSLPTEIRIDESTIRMLRLRQLVAPDGELSEEVATIDLDRFTLAELERDATAAGMQIVSARRISRAERYEDSIVVVMEVIDV